MATAPREVTELVRQALLDLHKELLTAARIEYERQHGVVGSPGELLRLVAHDEFFAWLHPISELIVALDDLLDTSDELAETDAAAVRVEVEEILSRREGAFRERYLAALQSSPEVVLNHASVQRAVSALPPSRPEDVGRMLQIRPTWAARRERGRPRRT
jgi:hypothetical protein